MALLSEFLGSIIRYLLAALVGSLVLKGALSPDLADKIVNSGAGQIAGWVVGVGVPLLWSFARTTKFFRAILTALRMPEGSTPAELKDEMKGGVL